MKLEWNEHEQYCCNTCRDEIFAKLGVIQHLKCPDYKPKHIQSVPVKKPVTKQDRFASIDIVMDKD